MWGRAQAGAPTFLCVLVSFLARYVRRQKELQRAARLLEFSIAYSTIARVQRCAKTNAANSVQLVMQSFVLILGHSRSASAIAMKPVKTKGVAQGGRKATTAK